MSLTRYHSTVTLEQWEYGIWCQWKDVAPLVERVKTAESAWHERMKLCQELVAERDRLKEALNYYSGEELLHGTHKDLVEKCERLTAELAKAKELLNEARGWCDPIY